MVESQPSQTGETNLEDERVIISGRGYTIWSKSRIAFNFTGVSFDEKAEAYDVS